MIKSKLKPNETSNPSKLPKKNKSPVEKAKPARTKSPSRSPARTKSPSRAANKSPSRAKTSPGRSKSPSRSKSPGRPVGRPPRTELSPPRQSSTPRVTTPRARSPLRQSSVRRSPPRLAKSVASERVLRPSRGKYDSDSGSDSDKPISVRLSRPQHVEVERVEVADPEPISALVRRFTRSSQSREVERIVHLKHFDNIALGKRLGEFSDEDDNVTAKNESLPSNLKQISEFGGALGALFFTLATFLGIFGLVVVCNENQCSFTRFPTNLKRFALFSTWFNSTVYLGFIAYATILALVSILPFGGRKVQGLPSKQGRFTYIMNGFFAFTLLVTVAIGLELKNIKISEFIVRNYFQLLCVSTLFGLFLTIYAFVRSFYVPFAALNVHTYGKNPLYAFFMGREVNPRAFGLLDLKMYVLRLGLIGPLLIDFAFLYNSFTLTGLNENGEESGLFDSLQRLNLNSSLILLVAMHSIYFFHTLLNEHTWITSFEIQYEGFGFMGGVGYLIYPFMVCSVTKYVVDYNVNLTWWQLVIISVIFLTGYVFFRGANNEKDAFRKNPYDPALAHLETIPTTRGKKLLCSGFWGVVRHPNYLGDILMNLAFAPFVLSVPPVITSLSIVVLLVHRSIRDNARCREKYGSAWDRYCNKVKFVLVPKVY